MILQNASQSSTWNGLGASNVIDGFFDEINGCGWRFSHTLPEAETWLRIDLAEWKHVVLIEIYNRINYSQRLSNTELYVYGESPSKNRQLCDIIVDGGFDHLKRVCKEPLFGKSVELYQPRTGQDRVINVCEVIVHGN